MGAFKDRIELSNLQQCDAVLAHARELKADAALAVALFQQIVLLRFHGRSEGCLGDFRCAGALRSGFKRVVVDRHFLEGRVGQFKRKLLTNGSADFGDLQRAARRHKVAIRALSDIAHDLHAHAAGGELGLRARELVGASDRGLGRHRGAKWLII